MPNETHRAPPRYNISDFFSSLLGLSVTPTEHPYSSPCCRSFPIPWRFNVQLSKQAPQKPHDFRQREHKPEGFEEEFLEWREDAPELI
jgi:hypothetical protein